MHYVMLLYILPYVQTFISEPWLSKLAFCSEFVSFFGTSGLRYLIRKKCKAEWRRRTITGLLGETWTTMRVIEVNNGG